MELKEQILKLKEEGKSLRDISKLLGCSGGTVSYHCNPKVKEKVLARKRINDRAKAENRVVIPSIPLEKEIVIVMKPVDWKYGEAICNARLVELGYDTYMATISGGEIDIVAIKDNIVYRVQVKSITPTNNESIKLSLERNSVNYKERKTKKYENIDFFLIYDGNNIYKVDFDDVKSKGGITLRYKVTKSNQKEKIKMASDYIF